MSSVSAAGRLRQLAEGITPDEWRVDAWEGGLNVVGEHAVAHLGGPMTMSDDAEPEIKARALADARLIAASPDLCRLLADCVEALEEKFIHIGECEGPEHQACRMDAENMARSLLARAAVLAGEEQNDE